jgi:hypothetical protein
MIPTRYHGILDYASAIALATVPRLMGWDRKVRTFTDVAAAGTLGYALATRYELGAFAGLTMRHHLMVDAAEGAGFLAAAALLEDEPLSVRAALAGYGLFALTAANFSDVTAYEGEPAMAPGKRTKTGAFVMAEDDGEVGYRPSLSLRDRQRSRR